MAFTQEQISAIQRVSAETGVPPDVLAGIMMRESNGKPRVIAANPRFVFSKASKRVQDSLAGTYAEKKGRASKPCYGTNSGARTCFRQVYAVSPMWGVRIVAWGWWQVLGLYAMRAYGPVNSETARTFYEAFKADPAEASIRAAISWWNINSGVKKYAIARDFNKLTSKYFGASNPRYARYVAKYAAKYREQVGTDAPQGAVAQKPQGPRVLYIGDSSSTKQKSILSRGTKGEVLFLAYGGTTTKWWYEVFAAKARTPKQKQARKKIEKFQPTEVRVVTLGGNDTADLGCMAKSGNEHKLKQYLMDYYIPLITMPLLTEFGGPPPVGGKAPKRCGGNFNDIRKRLNAAYKAVAQKVGKKYYDSYNNSAYTAVTGWHHSKKTYERAATGKTFWRSSLNAC